LRFRSFVGKSLQAVTLADLQDFADSLSALAPASQCRVLSSIKSLLAFGHRIGYLAFDVGRPLRLPANRNRLSERILGEGAIHKILALEPSRRNRALLRLLYAAGLRVFELCALTWQHLQERDDAGQVWKRREDENGASVGGHMARASRITRRWRFRFSCLSIAQRWTA